jgi:hypothetical protein
MASVAIIAVRQAHGCPLDRRDGGGVLCRVDELDQDEDEPCGDGGEAGDAGQFGGGDGHDEVPSL